MTNQPCGCADHLDALAQQHRDYADRLVAAMPGPRSRSQAEVGHRTAAGLRHAARKLRERDQAAGGEGT